MYERILMNKNYMSIAVIVLAALSVWHMSKKPVQKRSQIIDALIIGTNSEYKPFSFIKNNELVGVDIDIAKEVARRLEKSIIWKDMPFDALIPEIQLGNIHMIAAGMTPTKRRAQQVFFTTPYFGQDKTDSLIAVTRQTDRINSLDDLQGREIVVNEGYTADTYLSNIPGMEIIRLSTASVAEGMLAITSGRAFAFVAARSSIRPFLEKNISSNFNMFVLPDSGESYALVVSKQYPNFYTQVEQTIQEMHKDGTIKKILTKWGLV
jgi:polar amino acid transport system substrate-binding protein